MNDPHIWWYVTRASAIISWVLMTLSVVWGILLSTRIFRNSDNPGWLQDLHKYLGGASLVMVGLHMVSLMLDGWLSFTLPEVLIPFATDYRALPVALGILCFYLLLSVQVTSLFITRLPRIVWKAIHYGSYAALVLVALHAGLSGTDVGQSWYTATSIALVVLGLVSVLVRILASSGRKPAPLQTGVPHSGRESAVEKAPLVGRRETTGDIAASPVGLLLRTAIPQLERQTMVVAEITSRAAGVAGIRLVPLGGALLPAWRAGAHVTLHLPNGLQRQYSLCGDPADRGHFDLAVLRVDPSQGGSSYIHDHLRPGMTLEVDGPLNHFELEAAKDYLFIAGGIGITPIKAMIESLPPRRDWRLVYLGRSRTTMAFLPELLSRYPDRVTVFADDELSARPDLSGLARVAAEVYCCGPESLMAGVAQFVPPERLHFERFIPIVRTSQAVSGECEVTCARSGTVLRLSAGENILEALEASGLPISGSCRKGVCGTCEVRVLEGTPEHLDSVLSDTDKDALGVMYPCVSRSASREIVLDL